jgi:hypothetical protein
MAQNSRQYLSPAQVAERTPFTVKALEKMRALGKGPKWRRTGRRIVYEWSDVVDWIEKWGDQYLPRVR